MKRVSSLLCHRLLQMLWPMLTWVIESEGDQQLWSIHLLGSLTFKATRNIFINSWFLFHHRWGDISLGGKFLNKRNTIWQSGRWNSMRQSFFFLLIMPFSNKQFYQHNTGFPISFIELRVNYAHSSLTYLMAE